MITLIVAAAVAAAPAPADQHAQLAQQGQPAEHKGMDCKDCCKDMAAKHEGHAEHAEHSGR